MGAAAGALAADAVANLWWTSYPCTRPAIVGLTAGARTMALRGLAASGLPDHEELRRRVDLAAGREPRIDG